MAHTLTGLETQRPLTGEALIELEAVEKVYRMGKLDYRLKAGRPGGCPVLALGITPNLIDDWADHERAH